jgi:hypothetical protein
VQLTGGLLTTHHPLPGTLNYSSFCHSTTAFFSTQPQLFFTQLQQFLQFSDNEGQGVSFVCREYFVHLTDSCSDYEGHVVVFEVQQ